VHGTVLGLPQVAGVRPRSTRARMHKPWPRNADGEQLVNRSGSRDWFSDTLFAAAQGGHAKAGFGTSVGAHAACAIAIVALAVARPVRIVTVSVANPLRMPDFRIVPLVDPPPLLSAPAGPASAVRSKTLEPAAAAAAAPGPTPPAPVDAPSGIDPETGAEAGDDGVEGGIRGGAAGGIAGGTIGGAVGGGTGTGPVRVGGAISPPRKIKDVRPVYPPSALSGDVRGTVVIEATIGVDGKVRHATIVHSVPELDQAALDAVGQWEYEPSMLNGARVAVLLTIVLNFAIQ
jgi:periplasmic protein TonB